MPLGHQTSLNILTEATGLVNIDIRISNGSILECFLGCFGLHVSCFSVLLSVIYYI